MKWRDINCWVLLFAFVCFFVLLGILSMNLTFAGSQSLVTSKILYYLFDCQLWKFVKSFLHVVPQPQAAEVLNTNYVRAHVREETESPDSLSHFFFLFLFFFQIQGLSLTPLRPFLSCVRRGCSRKLISWACQAALAAWWWGGGHRLLLRSTGAVCWQADDDKPTPKANPPLHPHRPRRWVSEDRNLSMVSEIAGIPGIPPDSQTSRREDRRPRAGWGWGSVRGSVLHQSYPRWNEHRCNFSQDKGSLCFQRNTRLRCYKDEEIVKKEKKGAWKAEGERNRIDGVH